MFAPPTLEEIAKIPLWLDRYRAWRKYQRQNGGEISRRHFNTWDGLFIAARTQRSKEWLDTLFSKKEGQ